jgi:hypothetical protein
MRKGLSSSASARVELVSPFHLQTSGNLLLGPACIPCNYEVSNFLFIFMPITLQDYFRTVDIIQLNPIKN